MGLFAIPVKAVGTSVLLVCVLFGGLHPALADDDSQKSVNLPSQSSIRLQFEALAAQSSYFEIDDVLHRRAGFSMGQSAAENGKYAAFMERFFSIHAKNEDLIPLLKHEDPKVRTLAIAALASLDDPSVLPAIADLLADDAITFSREQPPSQQSIGPRPLRNDVTVGENAQEVLFLYLSQAGYTGYQLVGRREAHQKSRKEFDDYWSKHKGRDYCASWFAVRVDRASHSGPGQFDAAKARVRAEIDKLPQPDRAWIALWLGDMLYTKAELLGICRKLGPETLMDSLKKHRLPSDDPDLQRGNSNHYSFTSTVVFILQNAVVLLRPEDAAVLVTLSSGENASPWWFVAAADLQPGKAVEILHRAYDQFSGDYRMSERIVLDIALWRLAGESQVAFLTDRFYREALDPHSLHTGWGMEFIGGIAAIQNPSGKKLIASILQDKRLDDVKMDRMTFASIAGAVNKWAGKPVVSDEEIAQAGKSEGGKGGDPTPINLPLKRELLHRMRDNAPQWNT